MLRQKKKKKIKPIASFVKKYTANENSIVKKTKQNRLMLLSSYAASGKKKPTFTRNRELHNFNIISND